MSAPCTTNSDPSHISNKITAKRDTLPLSLTIAESPGNGLVDSGTWIQSMSKSTTNTTSPTTTTTPKQPMRVLCLDPLPPCALAAFESPLYQIEECFQTLSESELVQKIAPYQILCVQQERSWLYITDEAIQSAHRLLAIGVFSRSASQVDLVCAQKMGIPVFHSPYQHQHSAAEMILSSIILLSRQTLDKSMEIHQGTWNKTSAYCNEVRGKTVGIVGYGRTGAQLGIMAEALSLKVIFYDELSIMPIGRAEPKNSLADLLVEADYVVCTISSTPPPSDPKRNVHLFDAPQFALMRPKSYFINVTHGEAVNLAALAEALTSGHLQGAAIDAFPPGSLPGDGSVAPLNRPTTPVSPVILKLSELSNVILTPGIAGGTVEVQMRIATEVSTSLINYVANGASVGAINFPSISAWPIKPGMRRILNVHRNVRGVLREIDLILSNYNVSRQVLDTREGVGYLVADVSTDQVSAEVVGQLAGLANTIRMRIL